MQILFLVVLELLFLLMRHDAFDASEDASGKRTIHPLITLQMPATF